MTAPSAAANLRPDRAPNRAPTRALRPLCRALWQAWPLSLSLNFGLGLGWGLGLVLIAAPCAAADGVETPKSPTRPKLQTSPAGSGLCRPTNWRVPAEGLQLRPFGPAPEGETRFEADRLEGSLDGQVRLSGSVQVQLDDLSVRADRLTYDSNQSRLQASGAVQMLRAEDRFSGSELRYDSQTSTGYLLQPRFYLSATDAGGRAERIDLLGAQRMDLRGLRYSSCKVGDDETAPWQLTASRLQVDIAANEGIAEDAVLRFYDVPILALPKLSFPVTEDRKSGWLPPSIDLSTTGGLVVAAPYYWNIAPQHDATLTPVLSLKRGAELDGEFRYLQPDWRGQTQLSWLPHDEVAGGTRWASRWTHRGAAPLDSDYRIDWLRVSDEDYWTDGLRGADNLTPRLLGSSATWRQAHRAHWEGLGWLDRQLYASTQYWQVLNGSSTSDLITAPYRREAQLGAQWGQQRDLLDWSVQTEVNRFVPGALGAAAGQPTGQRAHLLGQLGWQLGRGGWRFTPRLGVNAAAYDLEQAMADGRRHATRVVPTFSLDSGWTFERELRLFDRPLTQTLEPRVLYVRTPWRDQSLLPNFDSDVLDFNPTTIFGDSSFSGVDRVADAQRITAGLTTRFVESGSGIEWARLGFAQRYLLQDQRITSDGQPLTQRMSDALLFGSTQAIPHWTLNGSLRYDPELSRVARSSASVTYSPGPWRTLHLTHSLQRGSSERFGVGWQWPIGGTSSTMALLASSPWGGARERDDSVSAGDCSGRLYTVGRIDYSKFDRRIAGALVGFEYDAGCWVGRVVAERTSTGASAATSRLMLQLEFVGLSRLALGSNPLTRLKDNIPGYRLLRERSGGSSDPAQDLAP